MNLHGKPKIVLLGMMGRMRVAGAVWQAVHYLTGFERLGCEAYYVEAHGCLPWAFLENEDEAAQFIAGVMNRFDFGGRWAFHARSGSGDYYGMSEQGVKQLYSSASAIINLHGGTVPTPEQSAGGRMVYIDTDPGCVQVEIQNGLGSTLDFLGHHCAFFTFAENYGRPDCRLPFSERFAFQPTRQPVVLDFWQPRQGASRADFTTVGNWQQLRRVIELNGEEYHWSKHYEFLKFIDLPSRAPMQPFELALSSCEEEARLKLVSHGWKVRDAFSFSHDLDAYREYIAGSRGEFTVAKDQNVRLRTGWFSDRAATYLAAGRPVVTQETGFSSALPAGAGLYGFSNMEEILAALDRIHSDYEANRRAALEIAREYFSHEVVLPPLLEAVGVQRSARRAGGGRADAVNIAGYFGRATGMGSAARRSAAAMEAAGIVVNRIDIAALDEGSAAPAAEGAVNLICCDIEAYFAARSHLGEDFFRGRYNIGLWLWELTDFPPGWRDRFVYHDEIWVPSSFIAAAVAPVAHIPVVRIPLPLGVPEAGSRERGRRHLGVTDDEFVYAFVFDFHSRAERKNPLAAIDAFRRGFPAAEKARLVIKCAHPDFQRDVFGEMERQASGHRISIHSGDWCAAEMADLVEACDCYVSLHRAEGVGLPMADAMAAGKPVVATGWSGNMDFMTVSNSFPVRYRLAPLDRNVAQYRAGDLWAEPDAEHAAELLRYVFDHREEAAARGEIARLEMQANYSTAAVSRMMADRLELISKRGRIEGLKTRLGEAAPHDAGLREEFADLAGYVPQGHLEYMQLKRQLSRVVRAHVPAAATLVVISKGDDELLRIHEGKSWHFPQTQDGRYAGHHPKDSAEAIGQLDALRDRGGQYLLLPRTSFWWLDHYTGFREHLHHRYQLAHSDEACRLFELSA